MLLVSKLWASRLHGAERIPVYPPGPAWVFILVDGVPSVAQKVLIGTGDSPPVDQGAIDK